MSKELENFKNTLLEKVKRSKVYEIVKTSEGAIVIGGCIVGIFVSSLSPLLFPIIGIGYTLLNIYKLSNDPLYKVRDEIKKELEKLNE